MASNIFKFLIFKVEENSTMDLPQPLLHFKDLNILKMLK